MGIFGEVRQRRLFQIVASYLAAGWVGLEVVDQLIQNEVAPPLVYRIVLVWYLAGIPAAVLIGWHHGEKGKQRAPLSETVTIAVLLLGVLTFTGMSVADHVQHQRAVAAAEASALDLHRIAVLYFDDHTPGQQYAHVADGLTEGLIDELSSVRGLEVVSRNGVRPFRGESVDPSEAGRALEAGSLVQGSIQQEGDELQVSIALLEGESGAAFERASFRRPAADPLAVQEELVSEVARLLRNQLREEIRVRRTRKETSSPAAWVLFQRAERERKAGEEALRHHDVDAARANFARSDSILLQVDLLDPDWAAAPLLRAELDYLRSRITDDRHERVALTEAGLREAQTVLDRDPNHARALALRGTLRYWQHLQHLAPDEEDSIRLKAQARADLERATELDPTIANAWSALMHLYIRSESLPDAVMAGQRAYEEDAYLSAAEDILWRLYSGHYDLANFTKALWACNEGARRFPLNDRFTSCQLELMHTAAVPPDPDHALELARRVEELAGEHRADYAAVQARLFYAGALARAGMPDSARTVLERAERDMTSEIDPERELLSVEAAMYSMLGDDDRAIDLLKRFKTANPHAAFDHHWWWRTVRSHPRYREIETEHH